MSGAAQVLVIHGIRVGTVRRERDSSEKGFEFSALFFHRYFLRVHRIREEQGLVSFLKRIPSFGNLHDTTNT